MKKIIVFIIFLLVTPGISPNIEAAPILSNSWAFPEHFGPGAESAGYDPGHKFQVGVFVNESDPSLHVPDDIVSVTAAALTPGEPSYTLSYFDPGPIFDAVGPMYLDLPFDSYTGQSGVWQITATNVNGESTSILTHNLDKPRLIPLAGNVTFSDCSTTPTIAWDPVFFDDDLDPKTPDVEVDRYRIRLLTSSDNQFFRSDYFTDTSFKVPEGFISPGDSIFFRIESQHFDDDIENRSSTFARFKAAAVPEPSTLLLLGSGLIGLIVLGRKNITG